MEVLPDIEENFGGIVDKDLADFFDGLFVAFINEFMIVLTGEVFFFEDDWSFKLIIMRFETSANSYVSKRVPSIMLSIIFQF